VKLNITSGLKAFIGKKLRGQFEAMSQQILGGDLAGAVQAIEEAQAKYPEFRKTIESIEGKPPEQAIEALAQFWPELREIPFASVLVGQLQAEMSRQEGR
jgi:hypothetical protein